MTHSLFDPRPKREHPQANFRTLLAGQPLVDQIGPEGQRSDRTDSCALRGGQATRLCFGLGSIGASWVPPTDLLAGDRVVSFVDDRVEPPAALSDASIHVFLLVSAPTIGPGGTLVGTPLERCSSTARASLLRSIVMPRKPSSDDLPIADAVERIDEDTVRQLLVAAAERYGGVAQAVRLAAADDDDRLAVLSAAVDDRLRTRRHLDYWASSAWAGDAAPVVDALTAEVAARPSARLVLLLQRAAEHLVKVILHADDSNGMIGALASDVLDQHRIACEAGVAEPGATARWMVRFTLEDQDFFTIDPVAYVNALGDAGLAVYRQEVANHSDPGRTPSFTVGAGATCTAGSRASPRSTRPNGSR